MSIGESLILETHSLCFILFWVYQNLPCIYIADVKVSYATTLWGSVLREANKIIFLPQAHKLRETPHPPQPAALSWSDSENGFFFSIFGCLKHISCYFEMTKRDETTKSPFRQGPVTAISDSPTDVVSCWGYDRRFDDDTWLSVTTISFAKCDSNSGLSNPWVQISVFSIIKMYLKISSTKRWPFRFSLNVLPVKSIINDCYFVYMGRIQASAHTGTLRDHWFI